MEDLRDLKDLTIHDVESMHQGDHSKSGGDWMPDPGKSTGYRI